MQHYSVRCIFVHPNNNTAASVWDFYCAHRCWCMWFHTGAVQTTQESLYWKLTREKKCLVTTGNQTLVLRLVLWSNVLPAELSSPCLPIGCDCVSFQHGPWLTETGSWLCRNSSRWPFPPSPQPAAGRLGGQSQLPATSFTPDFHLSANHAVYAFINYWSFWIQHFRLSTLFMIHTVLICSTLSVLYTPTTGHPAFSLPFLCVQSTNMCSMLHA